MNRLLHVFFCVLVFVFFAAAQAPQSQVLNPPVSYSSISELNQLLADLQQASTQIQQDLTHLRIEKWKTDSNTKRQTDSDVQSIQRNLKSALPEIVGQLRSSPEDLAATFKLYRNLDALYDVFSSVVESAGAFGSRDEFQSLQNDLSALERSRHVIADRMESLSTSKEKELGQLRADLRNAEAQINAQPPKKVIVDDTAPPPKPLKRKIVRKKPKTPAAPPAAAPAVPPAKP